MVETDKRTGHWAWKHPRKDGQVELVEMKGDIRLEGVDFGYFDDRMVLHNVDVYANPGEKIAFVGATGAGKTTITNLINRFYKFNLPILAWMFPSPMPSSFICFNHFSINSFYTT